MIKAYPHNGLACNVQKDWGNIDIGMERISNCVNVWKEQGAEQCALYSACPFSLSNLTHCLFLYDCKVKNGFNIFKWLKKVKGIIISCDMWKLYEIQRLVPIKLYWHTAMPIHFWQSWAHKGKNIYPLALYSLPSPPLTHCAPFCL